METEGVFDDEEAMRKIKVVPFAFKLELSDDEPAQNSRALSSEFLDDLHNFIQENFSLFPPSKLRFLGQKIVFTAHSFLEYFSLSFCLLVR